MMEAMATDALTAAADELYALVPEEFTAARNARAKDAKADDRMLGQRIGELRRPSPAAWIVNASRASTPTRVDELLDLGGDLRDAQAAGDGRALTRIGSERRTLVSALLQQATRIADAADRTPSRAVLDEVEQTLIAGTVDAAAGEALRTGRLVRRLQAVGFDDVDLDGAVAGEASAGRPAKRRAAAARAGPGDAAKGATKGAAKSGAKGAKAGTKHGGKAGAKSVDEADAAAAEREAAAARAAEREQAEADVRDARDRETRRSARSTRRRTARRRRVARRRAARRAPRLEARLRELRAEIADAERDEREAERVRAKAATAADRARDDVEAAETRARAARLSARRCRLGRRTSGSRRRRAQRGRARLRVVVERRMPRAAWPPRHVARHVPPQDRRADEPEHAHRRARRHDRHRRRHRRDDRAARPPRPASPIVRNAPRNGAGFAFGARSAPSVRITPLESPFATPNSTATPVNQASASGTSWVNASTRWPMPRPTSPGIALQRRPNRSMTCPLT